MVASDRISCLDVVLPTGTPGKEAAFRGAIGARSGGERVLGRGWRDADLFAVERRPPLPATSGKTLHLHVDRAGR